MKPSVGGRWRISVGLKGGLLFFVVHINNIALPLSGMAGSDKLSHILYNCPPVSVVSWFRPISAL